MANEAQSEGPYRYQYAIKFICTANLPGTSQQTPSLLPGVYQTVANLHNPGPQAARWRWKLALPGLISKFFEDSLKDDEADRITCERVTKEAGPFIHGFEGFVVVESTRSIDVVAVYTAGAIGGSVSSIDVERVFERDLRARPRG